MNPFSNPTFKKLTFSVLIIVLLEVFVFNFASFLTVTVTDEEQLDINSALLTNLSANSDGTFTVVDEDEAVITFRGIDKNISTVYIDIEFQDSKKDIEIDYTESSYKHFWRHDGNISIIKYNEHSKYALCNFSGKADDIRFTIPCEKNEEITLNSITINKKIPLNISLIRICYFACIVFIIIFFSNAKVLNKAVASGHAFSNYSTAIIGIFIIIALLLSSFASLGIVNDFTEPKTNQINKELVDAFMAGQVSLTEKPSAELLSLENPYDWSLREISDVEYLWDHCLYNGNYYSYYGIAPVLLLFLPYTLITGMYFPPVWAVFVFAFIGILFLGKTYELFVRKFFPSLPISIALMGLIIIELASGIWYCMPVPNFYEIAQSSGFAFTAMGAYFLLSSNAISKGKLSNIKAAISSVFLALSVLCRPTLAVYCIVALVFIAIGAKKAYKIGKKTRMLCYLAASLVPFVLIGGVQMIYNFLRFDSFFDFGIQYSLTINDFTKTEYHLPLALIGFYNFIFAPPVFSAEFPFINSNFSELGVNGYYFSANENAIGIFFRSLPVFSYIYSIKASRLCKNKSNILLIALLSVIAPSVIIFSIWESGYGVRYCADFYWQIIIGAFAVAYTVYINCLPYARKICKKLMLVSLLIAITVNGALIYDYLINNSNINMNAALLSFGRLFEFWNIM